MGVRERSGAPGEDLVPSVRSCLRLVKNDVLADSWKGCKLCTCQHVKSSDERFIIAVFCRSWYLAFQGNPSSRHQTIYTSFQQGFRIFNVSFPRNLVIMINR